MGFHSKSSSDLDVGRRPMLESDEFLLWNPIVMEIWRCENTYFSPKCSTTWDDASPTGTWWAVAAGPALPSRISYGRASLASEAPEQYQLDTAGTEIHVGTHAPLSQQFMTSLSRIDDVATVSHARDSCDLVAMGFLQLCTLQQYKSPRAHMQLTCWRNHGVR